MSSANLLVVLFSLTMALFGVSMAAHHNIGDAAGWTAAGTVDYATWASSNNFQVGDQLDFKYDHLFHNVMEVSRKDFESCNSSSPILTYTTGHDSVELTPSGHHYFLCSNPGHCDAGQKVHIFARDDDDDDNTCCPDASPPGHSSASSSTIFLSFKWFLGMYLVAHAFLLCLL